MRLWGFHHHFKKQGAWEQDRKAEIESHVSREEKTPPHRTLCGENQTLPLTGGFFQWTD